ncbi:MAG: Pr6Pr family membrane protein [Methylocella sp.]
MSKKRIERDDGCGFGAGPTSDAQRICAGILASVAWFGLVIEIVFSIQDAVAENASIATYLVNQFSRFSIQTTTLVALVGTLAFLRPQPASFILRPSVQAALVVYVVVVGVVFEVLLQSDSQGIEFVDRILHGAIPVLYLSYWLIFAPKGTLSWVDPALWLIYPLLFFVYTMMRGMIFGIYLQHVSEVIKQGYRETFLHTLVFFAAFLAVGLILVSVDQALAERRNRCPCG